MNTTCWGVSLLIVKLKEIVGVLNEPSQGLIFLLNRRNLIFSFTSSSNSDYHKRLNFCYGFAVSGSNPA
jgi:hypothetical protein